jgi:hypothetical protein
MHTNKCSTCKFGYTLNTDSTSCVSCESLGAGSNCKTCTLGGTCQSCPKLTTLTNNDCIIANCFDVETMAVTDGNGNGKYYGFCNICDDGSEPASILFGK